MRRTLTLLLTFAMILSLCACGGGGGGGEEKPQGLQVGYGRGDITAPLGTPLAGYGNDSTRKSTQILDTIYATCLAMRNGDDTVLLFGTDALKSEEKFTQAVRERLTAETGVPAERILISATHTHSAPSMNTGGEYVDIYVNGLTAAAKAALADLAPATISTARDQVEDLNYVRHYKKADGSYCGDGFGNKLDGEITGYATEADKEIILVKFDRPDDKKDILLMNFQAHPCQTGNENKTDMSSDFVGFTRKILEDETGMHFIYFTGAAGNQNTNSYIASGNDVVNNVNKYSQRLSEAALELLEDLAPVEGAGLKTVHNQFTYASNRAELEKAAAAQKLLQMDSNTEEYRKLMQEAGLTSGTHIKGVAARPGRPETYTMELNAIYFGGIAFVLAPYEMFTDSARYIKENSPVETTVICTLANQYWNYFASKEAYDYYSYEGNTSKFARGCAEDTAAEFVKMIKSIVP